MLPGGRGLCLFIGNRSDQLRTGESWCALVLFYRAGCPFCADLAPSYNALGRAFPQLPVLAASALDYSR